MLIPKRFRHTGFQNSIAHVRNRFSSGGPCIGYLGHPFVKLTTWSFTTLLFIFVMWYSAIDVAGQCFSAFLSDTPQIAFADRISSWCVKRRFENLNGTRCRHASKARPNFTIIITNQILWRLPIWGGFSELLRDPGIGRRSCHAYVDYLS